MTIGNREVRVFDNLEQLSWAAAARFEELARAKIIEKKPFSVALSGGSTPKLLYELLGSPAFAGRVRWSNVHLFQVDERCVSPDDSQSNYRLIRQALLGTVPLPEENFHRMAAERPDREQATRDYAEEMARILLPGRFRGTGVPAGTMECGSSLPLSEERSGDFTSRSDRDVKSPLREGASELAKLKAGARPARRTAGGSRSPKEGLRPVTMECGSSLPLSEERSGDFTSPLSGSPSELARWKAGARPARRTAGGSRSPKEGTPAVLAPGEWPCLDLAFLGMGADGHTASLFPGSAALEERTAWVVPNFVAKLNSFRLTLTLPVLNTATHVIFLVAGEDKAETLREVLEGPEGRFPAQLVRPARGRVSWLVDRRAAGLLSAASSQGQSSWLPQGGHA